MRSLFGLMLWLFLSGTALAMPGYEAFPEAARVPLRVCGDTQGASWQRQQIHCGAWRVERRYLEASGREQVSFERRGHLKLRLEYPIQGAAAGGFNLWLGDVNGDRLEDVIVAEHSGGNGLAAWIDTVSFALSSKNGYRVTSLSTRGFSAADVLRLRGQTFVVDTQFIGGAVWQPGQDDGRQHSYWVNTLLRVRADRLEVTWRPAPVWIQYTRRPNRRAETKTRLSQAQRERLWREQAEAIFVTYNLN
jgi:hypothetical protein